MNKILLYINTIKFLKVKQLAWRVYYIVRKKLGFIPKVELSNYSILEEISHKIEFLKPNNSYISENIFSFLNEKQRIHLWNDDGMQKLWLYNLHYFDYLLQDNPPSSEIIDKWIKENPVGFGNGWEAYPISLRIINWIKYHIQVEELSKNQLDSLYLQVKFLSKNIEYHILGNHLFENAKSLYIAGMFFNDKNIERIGLKILKKEVDEQILADGAHFELSPMYHSIILEGLLDIINVSNIFNRKYPSRWNVKVDKMLHYLQSCLHQDGNFACFNDSTFDIAKPSMKILSYGQNLGFTYENLNSIEHFKDSGLIRIKNDKYLLLFDAGKIGPGYIPGHAHADNLNFELSVNKQRVIVDTGISTYEKCSRRELERSTSAHNTVEIDGKNQSEVWSSFRVGNRVYPQEVSLLDKDKYQIISAAYTGRKHKRTVLAEENKVTIKDTLRGIKKKAISHLHFHPEVDLLVENNKILGSIRDKKIIEISILSKHEFEVEEYKYSEGFNFLVKANRLKILTSKDSEIEISLAF